MSMGKIIELVLDKLKELGKENKSIDTI